MEILILFKFMAISYTGLSYFLLSLSLAFLTYKFFQYWQRSRDTTSKCFYYFGLSLTAFAFVRAFTGLFFANNTKILLDSTVAVAFFEGLTAAIVAYLVFYLKLPKISPWVGFGIVFTLGIGLTIVTFITSPFQPILEATGSINFVNRDITPLLYTILRMLILLIVFIPLIIILIQQRLATSDIRVKTKSFGLSLVLFLAIIISFFQFFFTEFLNLGSIGGDIILSITSIFIFIIVFITQKPPSADI